MVKLVAQPVESGTYLGCLNMLRSMLIASTSAVR